jgi:hypothetical protein
MRRGEGERALTGCEIHIEGKHVAQGHAKPAKLVLGRQPWNEDPSALREEELAPNKRSKASTRLDAAAKKRPPGGCAPAQNHQGNPRAAGARMLKRASN